MGRAEITQRLMDLYSKTVDGKMQNVKFTEDELKFIMANRDRSTYICHYIFYKKPSKHPLGFMIDSAKNAPRRSMVFNGIDIICSRELTDIEWEEDCENFGTRNRRFTTWWYSDIHFLIEEDKLYEVNTPKEIINEFKKRRL